MREQDEQGTEHYVTAVVSGNDSEANSQISQKHCMLLGKFDRRKNRRARQSLKELVGCRFMSNLNMNGNQCPSGSVSCEAQSLDKVESAGVDLRAAFTMAEILLSLTIIGVVAAITLPSLTGNINERTWNTQRKALYARMSQAIALMPALNGYGNLKEESSEGASDAEDTATETFLTDGLSKVLKINNICDNEHLEDCGVVTSFTNMAGSRIDMPATLYDLNDWFRNASFGQSMQSYSTINTKAAAFETQNGESIVSFYNQSCRTEYRTSDQLNKAGDEIGYAEANMCINFIYDLNGNKGPNTIGKDMGIMTVFNAIDSIVVAPMPSSSNNSGSATWYNAAKTCTSADSESRLPNIDELSAMLINKDIVNLTASTWFWSSSVYNTERAWAVNTSSGDTGTHVKKDATVIRCVKR